MSDKKLIVIDGNSLLYRAFYGIRYFSTANGQPTNALYGLAQMLQRVLDEKPDYIAVAFDTPKPTFRHVEYEDYKGHRKAPPDELIAQMSLARDLVRAFNIPVLEVEGFEADDVIGAVSKCAESKGIKSTIVTGDLDTLQLVNENINVMATIKGVTDTVIYDYDAVVARFGVTPEQMVDYKGLKGDPSDNIPGVPGIGEKTATDLVKRFGNIENLLEHLDELPEGKIKKSLIENKELAIKSKWLSTIVCDLPEPVKIEELAAIEPDYSILRDLFVSLEFKTLLRRLPEAPVKAQVSTIENTERKSLGKCTQIQSDSELKKLIESLQQAGKFAMCCHTSNNKTTTSKLIGISFCTSEGSSAYVDIFDNLNEKAVGQIIFDEPYKAELEHFSELFSDENIEKICHDSKLDIALLKLRGISLKDVSFDTMMAAYIIDATRGNYDLENVAFNYLSLELSAPKQQKTLDLLDDDSGALCGRAEAVYMLASVLADRLKSDNLMDLYKTVELPLTSVLAEMELNGIPIDFEALNSLSITLDVDIKTAESKIFEAAGEEFNIGSPKQLQTILFEKLNLQASKKTKTGYSTNAAVLEELAVDFPIVEDILKFRELTKIKSTYADALPKLINPLTGRIHTSFNQTGTTTGRLSSSDPNLQNIPIKTELGREIRKAFVASGDNLLLSADYSQIEFRIFAHITSDPWLVDAFENDEDIHRATAESLFNVSAEEVTSEMRRRAKTINFSVMYGMADFTLSKQLGLSVHEAKSYIEEYFARFPKVKETTQAIIENAKKTGYVETLLGRRRYVPDINNSNRNIRNAAERAAINTPFQGTAADIMKLAMIKVYNDLKSSGLSSKMLLQVHDELVLEVPPNELARVMELVRNGMQSAYKLIVPLKAELKTGKNWSEME